MVSESRRDRIKETKATEEKNRVKDGLLIQVLLLYANSFFKIIDTCLTGFRRPARHVCQMIKTAMGNQLHSPYVSYKTFLGTGLCVQSRGNKIILHCYHNNRDYSSSLIVL